jgi:hypothetical protein
MLLATASGCTPVDPAPPPTAAQRAAYNYNWAFINRSEIQLTIGRVYVDSPRGRIAITNPVAMPAPGDNWGTYTTSGATPAAVPDHVILEWSTADGLPHEQTVSLAGLVDPAAGPFRGSIWFSYGNAGWHADALTRQQMTDRVRQGRSWAPDVH